MALTNVYVQVYGQLEQLFQEIRRGQAPGQFTIQHLKDLGFMSSNHRAFIPLLKALGFLSADGEPTKRYHEYRDASQSKRVMAEALRHAYGDVFVLRANPTKKDQAVIEGKFKSAHNVNDRLAKLMTSTFFALLSLADLEASPRKPGEELKEEREQEPKDKSNADEGRSPTPRNSSATNLHYNIQIHLPATKDIEVFNAIFKSIREHLIE
jgi:hypothetical protein